MAHCGNLSPFFDTKLHYDCRVREFQISLKEFVSLNSHSILCMDQNYLKWRVVENAFVGSSTGEKTVSQSTKGLLQDRIIPPSMPSLGMSCSCSRGFWCRFSLTESQRPLGSSWGRWNRQNSPDDGGCADF